ncbi:unnamed protein product [Symbiodinium microadriaticum]|nr:unnamed protein product [Symbiodinium microadriaticum]
MSKRDSSTRKIEKQGEPERKKKKGKAEEPVNPSEPSRPAITFPIAQLTTEAFAAHSLPDPEEDQQPGAQALSKDGIPGIIADESFDTIKETLEALRPSWSPHTTNSKAIGLLAYPRLLIRPHNVDVEEIPKSEELFRSKRDALSMLKRCMLAAKTTPKVSSTEVAGMKSIEFLPLDNPFSWSWTKLAAFLLRFNSVPNLFTISTKNRNEPIVDKNGTRAIEAVPVERIEGPLHYLIQALRASGTGHAITHIGEVGVGSLVPLTLATSYACGQLGLRRDFYISQFIVALIQKGDPSHLASGGSVLGSSASHVTMGSLASKTSFFGNPQGILVQPVFGKAIHRAFRRLPAEVFERQAAPLQIGGRRGMTYAFGTFLSRNFLHFAQTNGLSAGLIFSDLAAAYYAVVREAVVGASLCEEPLLSIAASLKLDPDAFQELQHHIIHDSVFDDECTPVLRSLLREAHVATWFHISQDDRIIRTRRGTRPGSCLADVVFNLLFEKVLARRGEFDTSLTPRIPWTGAKSLVQFDGHADSAVVHATLQDISYADDHASCVVSRTARDLAGSVRHVLGRSLDSICGHGLTVNFGPRKTAALLAHKGDGSRAARDEVFHKAKGKLRVLREFGTPVDVDVVPYYKHLGSVVSFSGTMLLEIRGRVSRAKVSFGEGRKKVFACPQISLGKRVTLFQQHVLSAMFAGAGSWPSLCKGAWKLLDSCITSFCRQMLRIPYWADQKRTKASIFSACGLPDTGEMLHAERLRFLGQLVRTGPDPAWAVLQHSPPALEAFRSACRWLDRAVCSTWTISSFDKGWDEWLHVMLQRPKFWKGVIRRALSWYGGIRSIDVLIDDFARGMWDPLPVPEHEIDMQAHACLICKKAFCNAQTWASHASLQHGYRAPHFVAAKGHRCRACGAFFANVRRHRTHLQVSKRCLQSVLRSDPSLLPVVELADGHVQSRAIAGRGLSHLSPIEADFSPQLLQDLRTNGAADDEVIFRIVSAHVCPFPTLRQTLIRWISELGDSPIRSSAEDVLLCFRVDLLCDVAASRTSDAPLPGTFRPLVLPLAWAPRPAGLPGLLSGVEAGTGRCHLRIEPGGGWRTYGFRALPPACADFAGAFVQLPRPPLSVGVFGDVPSCSLRVLRKHVAWLGFALGWISTILSLAKRGRRCILDLTLVPTGTHPLAEWLALSCQAEYPALQVRFTP